MNTLAPSFFDLIILILTGNEDMHESLDEFVTRTCMKAWMSSNFSQIPTPTPELSALARLKNCCIMLCPL